MFKILNVSLSPEPLLFFSGLNPSQFNHSSQDSQAFSKFKAQENSVFGKCSHQTTTALLPTMVLDNCPIELRPQRLLIPATLPHAYGVFHQLKSFKLGGCCCVLLCFNKPQWFYVCVSWFFFNCRTLYSSLFYFSIFVLACSSSLLPWKLIMFD